MTANPTAGVVSVDGDEVRTVGVEHVEDGQRVVAGPANLILEGFGLHAGTVIPLSGATFIVGPNRCGKTTVRDALEFLLLATAWLRGLPTKKAIGAQLVAAGAKHARVTYAEPDGVAARRTIRPDGAHHCDESFRGRWVRADSVGLVPDGVPDAAVRLSLGSDVFVRGSDSDRRDLLASLAADRHLTPAAVRAVVSGKLTDAGVDDTLSAAVRYAAAGEWEAANAVAVEARREAKRRLAEVERAAVADAPDPFVGGVDVRAVDVPGGLRAARDYLFRARGRASIDRAGLESALAAARVEAARAEEASTAADAEARRAADLPGEASWEDVLVAGAEFGERLARARAERERLEAEVSRMIASLALAQREVDRANAAASGSPPSPARFDPPARCPAVAGREWACPVSPFVFPVDEAAERARVQALVEAEAAYETAAAELATARRQHETRDAECSAARGVERTAANAWRLLKEAIEAATRARAEHSRRGADAARLERELSMLGEPVSLEHIAFLEARLSHWEAVERRRSEVLTHQRETAAAQSAAETLAARVEALDLLEHEFRSDGVRARLTGRGADVVSSWIGIGSEIARLSIGADFSILVNGRPFGSCSKSEQLCAGAVLQLGAVVRYRLPFLVVDEVDALDVRWRGRFVEFVRLARSLAPWAQFIALATSSADPPTRAPEGFATVWIRTGPDGAPEAVPITAAGVGAAHGER